MFCGNCGAKLSPGACFCPMCGTPVEKNDSNRDSAGSAATGAVIGAGVGAAGAGLAGKALAGADDVKYLNKHGSLGTMPDQGMAGRGQSLPHASTDPQEGIELHRAADRAGSQASNIRRAQNLGREGIELHRTAEQTTGTARFVDHTARGAGNAAASGAQKAAGAAASGAQKAAGAAAVKGVSAKTVAVVASVVIAGGGTTAAVVTHTQNQDSPAEAVVAASSADNFLHMDDTESESTGIVTESVTAASSVSEASEPYLSPIYLLTEGSPVTAEFRDSSQEISYTINGSIVEDGFEHEEGTTVDIHIGDRTMSLPNPENYSFFESVKVYAADLNPDDGRLNIAANFLELDDPYTILYSYDDSTITQIFNSSGRFDGVGQPAQNRFAVFSDASIMVDSRIAMFKGIYEVNGDQVNQVDAEAGTLTGGYDFLAEDDSVMHDYWVSGFPMTVASGMPYYSDETAQSMAGTLTPGTSIEFTGWTYSDYDPNSVSNIWTFQIDAGGQTGWVNYMDLYNCIQNFQGYD